MDTVVDDYATAGQDLIQRTAKLHANERQQLQDLCRQHQRDYMRSCEAALQRTASFAKQFQSIDLGIISAESVSSSTLSRLRRIQEAMS